MHRALAPGLTHIQSLDCDDRLIVSGLRQEGPGAAGPAFATAFVVGLIEWACIEALRPYLEDGEQTVGSQVYVTHAAPAAASRKVTAIAELVAMNGRSLRFRVECFDECEQIGSGFHERLLIAAPHTKSSGAKSGAGWEPAVDSAGMPREQPTDNQS
jgi:fluoroacetyl-CoA thioesterase